MGTFVIVTYGRKINGWTTEFTRGDYFTRDTFEDALRAFDTAYWAGNSAQIWWFDTGGLGWTRLRFQDNLSEGPEFLDSSKS